MSDNDAPGMTRPKARVEGLLTEWVEGELVIYDETGQMAHSLSAEAASVWDRCDGRRSQSDIASQLEISPEIVRQAVAQFDAEGLLATEAGYTRRKVGKRFAAVGGAALAANALLYSVPVAASAKACSHPACTNAPNTNDFNAMSPPNYLWIPGIINFVGGTPTVGSQVTETGGTVSFSGNNGQTYNLALPDSVITIIAQNGTYATSFSAPTAAHPAGQWVVSVPAKQNTTFITGVGFQIPAANFDLASGTTMTVTFNLSGPLGQSISSQFATIGYTLPVNATTYGTMAPDQGNGAATNAAYVAARIAGGSNGSESNTTQCTIACP